MEMPGRHEFINPVLEVLRSKGGAAPLREISALIIDSMGLSDLADIPHAGDSIRSEIYYRVSWAIQTLQHSQLVKNTGGFGGGSATWELTADGSRSNVENPYDLYREYRRATRKSKARNTDRTSDDIDETPQEQEDDASSDDADYAPTEDDWKEDLLAEIRNLSPDGFERLCQRILGALGFEDVLVTGKSGDGGIDGVATLRQLGVLSSRVYFQCKRYSANNPVTPEQVRGFRGALSEKGQGSRGLFITTGRFTKQAEETAFGSGGIPIDIIDGDRLADRMRALELGGVETKVFMIDRAFFRQFSEGAKH